MRRMDTLVRVSHIPRIVVNKYYTELEEIMEVFGIGGGGYQGWWGDKIKGRECELLHDATGMKLSLFWLSFPTIEGFDVLSDDTMGCQITYKKSIIYFKPLLLLYWAIKKKSEYVLIDLTNVALHCLKLSYVTNFIYY